MVGGLRVFRYPGHYREIDLGVGQPSEKPERLRLKTGNEPA